MKQKKSIDKLMIDLENNEEESISKIEKINVSDIEKIKADVLIDKIMEQILKIE